MTACASPEPAAAPGRARRQRPGRGRPTPWLLPVALLLVVGGVLPAPAPEAPEAARVPVEPQAARVPALRMPVAGAVVRGFELPAGPYGPGHRGIDIAAPVGARARAPTAGQVAFAGPVAGRVWVTLQVAPGVLVTLGPLLGGATVGPARRVQAGAPVGQVAPGHGPADGATLHLSLRVDGVYVDPLPYLVDRPRPRLAPLLVPGGRSDAPGGGEVGHG